MFRNLIFVVGLFVCIFSPTEAQPKPNVDCPPGDRYRSRAKPYYPSFEQGGFVDMVGARLNTLQDYLAGEASFVTLSLDSQVPIPVGTPICISEINRKYNRNVIFKGKKFTVCHICVQNETFADDKFFNQFFTLVIPKNPKVNDYDDDAIA